MLKMDTKVKDALDHVRAATQELHGAIGDGTRSAAEPRRPILRLLRRRPRLSRSSPERTTISTQKEDAKKHLADAVSHLEATQKHVAESERPVQRSTSVQRLLARHKW